MGKSDSYRQLYALENGRFIPVNVRRPGREPKYPLHKLDVGESFFIEGATEVNRYLYEKAKKKNLRIKQRTVVENGVQGVRVWRLPDKKSEGGKNA